MPVQFDEPVPVLTHVRSECPIGDAVIPWLKSSCR